MKYYIKFILFFKVLKFGPLLALKEMRIFSIFTYMRSIMDKVGEFIFSLLFLFCLNCMKNKLETFL